MGLLGGAAGAAGVERPGRGGGGAALELALPAPVDWAYEGGAGAPGAGEGLLLLRERLEKALAAWLTAGGGFAWKRAAMELTPPA